MDSLLPGLLCYCGGRFWRLWLVVAMATLVVAVPVLRTVVMWSGEDDVAAMLLSGGGRSIVSVVVVVESSRLNV